MTSAHSLGHFLRTLPASAAATFLALFPIVDPFGGIPIFFTMTSSWDARDRDRTAFRTGVWVFLILITFLFFGRFVLHFFGISLPVLKIAGGLIVANSAWGMVTSTARITPAETHEAENKEDISLTPLAMPLMSGPGAIGVVMALAAHVDNWSAYIGMLIGIAGIALSVTLFFWMGGPLYAGWVRARLEPSTGFSDSSYSRSRSNWFGTGSPTSMLNVAPTLPSTKSGQALPTKSRLDRAAFLA